MKRTLLTTMTLVLGGLLTPELALAHGGRYPGPGDTVPPTGGTNGGGPAPAPPGVGPAGPAPTTPTPAGAPVPGPGGRAVPGVTTVRPVTGADTIGVDLTSWVFWWERNKEPYLQLKAHLHEAGAATGSDGFFLGAGQRENAKDVLRPSRDEVTNKVVPALLRALEDETNNDIVTSVLVALAKIGDTPSADGGSRFVETIRPYLSDPNQEISETAAIALGILGHEGSIATLTALLEDTEHARRELVRASEVGYRTRTFAAYGLGLIGSRVASETHRQEVVKALELTLTSDDTRSRDLAVACIVSMGMVPLETLGEVQEGERPAAHTGRLAQLALLLELLEDGRRPHLVRSHCPVSLARLLAGETDEDVAGWRTRVTNALLRRVTGKAREENEVVQSCVLALGRLAGSSEEDGELRAALADVPREIRDQQARHFSTIAMAKAGGAPSDDPTPGISDAAVFLLEQLGRGKSSMRPWAGLGIGVLARSCRESGRTHPSVTAATAALRSALADEKNAKWLAAYAIACGMARDVESTETLLERLDELNDDEARGYVALALGLMNERRAQDPIREVVVRSKYRPELLRQAAIALGLLGDKEVGTELVAMLEQASSLATQASIASALGFIGDRNSIDPLVAVLEDEERTPIARAFAAVALGIVADPAPLPWNAALSEDLNYRAATATLTDHGSGTGVLDIL